MCMRLNPNKKFPKNPVLCEGCLTNHSPCSPLSVLSHAIYLFLLPYLQTPSTPYSHTSHTLQTPTTLYPPTFHTSQTPSLHTPQPSTPLKLPSLRTPTPLAPFNLPYPAHSRTSFTPQTSSTPCSRSLCTLQNLGIQSF